MRSDHTIINLLNKSFLLICGVAVMFIISCGGGDDIDLNGTITGKISNELTGDPVAGATVSLSGLETKSETIGSDGLYRFENLITGTYTILVSHPGFEENSVEISLQPGETAEGDIPLEPIAPLDLTPTQLDFGTTVSEKEVTIKNNSGDDIDYEVQLTTDWLSISKTQGSLPSLTQDLLAVTVDRSQLAVGNHESTIVFNVPGRGSKTVQVLVEILP